MKSIFNYSKLELEEYLVSVGEKKFRAEQIFEWLYRFRVNSFDEMTNISKKLLEKLKAEFEIDHLIVDTIQKSADGTRKFLFKLNDGRMIESVLMVHNYGNSICVTSQVGCNMGCSFCASGELGKIRNLTLAEMTLQVLEVQKMLDPEFQNITNIVVMGIGEPFDNFETLKKFLEVVNFKKGLEIGARHITVSTCGIVPKIYEFKDFPLQINLAVSLHAPNNPLRSQIMKINNHYQIEEIITALKDYIAFTNRRVTFEYILLRDINDTAECAHQLVKLVRGMNVYINLIPYNEVSTKPYKKATKIQAERFLKILSDNNIQVTLRKEHGGDISAACGQLRAKREHLI